MIESLASKHVKTVAALHCATLTGLLSQLGATAAEAFYEGCVRTNLATGLVDLRESAVCGFVLGSLHPDLLRRDVLRKNPVDTLAALAAGVVSRPSAMVSLLRSFRGPDEGHVDGRVPELTYLAVVSDNRGGGTGRSLVEAFSDRMRLAGVDAYDLSVDEENAEAIAFYERLGFRQIGRYLEFGIRHRRYRLIIRGD